MREGEANENNNNYNDGHNKEGEMQLQMEYKDYLQLSEQNTSSMKRKRQNPLGDFMFKKINYYF